MPLIYLPTMYIFTYGHSIIWLWLSTTLQDTTVTGRWRSVRVRPGSTAQSCPSIHNCVPRDISVRRSWSMGSHEVCTRRQFPVWLTQRSLVHKERWSAKFSISLFGTWIISGNWQSSDKQKNHRYIKILIYEWTLIGSAGALCIYLYTNCHGFSSKQ